MYHKTEQFRRHTARVHKARKVFIGKNCMHYSFLESNKRMQGQLVKGKIHCSCPLCSCKSTRDRGVATNSHIGYSISDRRKFASLADSFAEYEQSA